MRPTLFTHLFDRLERIFWSHRTARFIRVSDGPIQELAPPALVWSASLTGFDEFLMGECGGRLPREGMSLSYSDSPAAPA